MTRDDIALSSQTPRIAFLIPPQYTGSAEYNNRSQYRLPKTRITSVQTRVKIHLTTSIQKYTTVNEITLF